MGQQADDDLAAALPPSLTVDLHLPDPVHEAPAPEDVVEIDAPPVAGAPTVSVPIVVVAAPATGGDPAAGPEEAASAPVPVPLPERAEPAAVERRAPRSERPAKPVKPVKPGKRPRPEGRWPEFVYAATLHLVNLGDSPAVRARKALDARIARPAESARFVPVLSRKGGVGTTTLTALVGMALAEVREDRVLAIDANPDRGTLADRITRQPRSTVRDIVLNAHELSDPERLEAHVTRDVSGLDVAGSAAETLLGETFDDGAYHVVSDVVAPHYGVVLTDAGAGLTHAATRAALQRADAVLVVSGGGIDEARLASEALTWLEANQYGALVENAVVAINTSTQGTDLEMLPDIEKHFRSRVRAVVRIPYDPALSSGAIIRLDALRPFTRDSVRDLAAALMDGFDDGQGAE